MRASGPFEPRRGNRLLRGACCHMKVNLIVVEKSVGDVLILALRGRLVLGPETEYLRREINEALAAGSRKILVDLGEVTYIDSSGLSTLVASYTSVRKQSGELKLLHLTRRIRDLLQITRLSTVFDLYDSQKEAVASFAPPAPPET
jgi:anti-sigma B factor antagonist